MCLARKDSDIEAILVVKLEIIQRSAAAATVMTGFCLLAVP